MAGLLYFAKQFRFAHDALEDLFESEGYTFDNVFRHQNFVFVIVHAEADYLVPLKVGDKLEVHLSIEKLGNSSMCFFYNIYKTNRELVGTVKTVHVCLDSTTRIKIPIPSNVRELLSKHLMHD